LVQDRAVRRQFELGSLGAAEAWLDTQLVLAAWKDYTEQVALADGSEQFARSGRGLRQGKVAVKARLRLTVNGEEYAFVFDARNFAVSG